MNDCKTMNDCKENKDDFPETMIGQRSARAFESLIIKGLTRVDLYSLPSQINKKQDSCPSVSQIVREMSANTTQNCWRGRSTWY